MILPAYRLVTALARPLVPVLLRARLSRGKEDAARLGERQGLSDLTRPDGKLLWVHAASVGEAEAVRCLIARLRDGRPDLAVLLTTGTLTSATLAADRAEPGLLHQFLPWDVPAFVSRFLDHWRPDSAIFVESELWPNLLVGLQRRRIPAALVNGRMSARSFARWRRLPGTARLLLGTFSPIACVSDADRERIAALGTRADGPVGNLKLAAAPLKVDEAALASVRAAVGRRPFWLAASTHGGEERMVLEAHLKLRSRRPNLLTIIVPRHPERGSEIVDLAASMGLAAGQRSTRAPPGGTDAIYVADTLGELGLFYRLAPIAFVGGSLVPAGGHNPIEPALLDTAVLFGPGMANAREAADLLLEAGGAAGIAGAGSLAAGVGALLGDPAGAAAMAMAAKAAAGSRLTILDDVAAALDPILPTGGPG